MVDSSEYLAQATRMNRQAFAAACPFLFLFGEVSLDTSLGPAQITLANENEATWTSTGSTRPTVRRSGPVSVALAVRKRTRIFRTMITVGRTRNHDIVLAHASISKFHAFFRYRQTGDIEDLMLADAGSRNGTSVNGVRLSGAGEAVRIQPGDLIRLSDVELLLLEAGKLWDRVHHLDTP
jgi:hypothetical protein